MRGMNFKDKGGEPTTNLSAEQLIAMGYRRVSNAYRHVTRIDRPDWVRVLAVAMHRSEAEFYEVGASTPTGMWCGHYRSCFSKDTLTVCAEEFRKIPSSGHDTVGYVPPFDRDELTKQRDILFAALKEAKDGLTHYGDVHCVAPIVEQAEQALKRCY